MKGNNSILHTLFVGVCMSLGILTSCQDMDRPEMNIIPDDLEKLNGPLQRYITFENSAIDSIHYVKGTATNITYVEGVSGRAYKGASNGHIEYPSAGKLAEMTSFTVAFWMNTEKHVGGAQSIFMMPNTDDFWGNMFAIIEGNNNAADNSMLMKIFFNGQWVEFSGSGTHPARLPDMYGKWKHVAFSYDETTSKFSMYIDGQKLNLGASNTDRKNGANPLGPLAFRNVSKFVIGAYQQHINIKAPADAWMLRYTGMLDQFRVYTTVLTDDEINTLYTAKR
ncbi:LamG-like jellyroll fold domain-containing protein [Pontibacter sp. SGAir0037]|uniref:LamG-like jellyroll fold domain-containing protein n=1 Tax=Pontibacter sp. SGAir0037 TaxID=2571030 RepID=UPI0010CD1C08|nr:LamG-like jellyroll fold domain-containing protein [Pontibacter sp. SGAir0037]QCR22250.1 hypothetical protein C1N53_07780 [Pontibacter sp. SGAir0037]